MITIFDGELPVSASNSSHGQIILIRTICWPRRVLIKRFASAPVVSGNDPLFGDILVIGEFSRRSA